MGHTDAADSPELEGMAPPSLDRLDPERLGGFLEVALVPDTLLRLCRKLSLSSPGYRLEKLAAPDHAALLADDYAASARNRPEIDAAVAESLGNPALRTTWVPPAAARELVHLVASDPLQSLARLAWRYCGDDDPAVRRTSEQAIDAGLALLKQVDDAAQPTPATKAPGPAAPAPDASALDELQKRVARAERDREAARAQLHQARTEIAEKDRRLGELKHELSSLQVEHARQSAELSRLSASRSTDDRKTAQEARKLASERSHFERQIATLEAELEAEKRRTRELERAQQERAQAPAAPADESDTGDASALDFTIPNFTREFYESLERWDRRVVKVAFEKAMHLARDHRHPSLRALPLEGIDNYFRIRIASDVRLIYRRAPEGRVDILSLIDREDLDRYVRQAKTRPREG